MAINMNKPCQHIVPAIDIALAAGNEHHPLKKTRNEYGNYIIYMYDPLIPSVKKQIDEKCTDLVYKVYNDAHYHEVSYGCNKCKVFLFFPIFKDLRPLYKRHQNKSDKSS